MKSFIGNRSGLAMVFEKLNPNTYLDIIRQLETSSTTDKYKYQVLIEAMSELAIGRDCPIFQNDTYREIIFQSLPILHKNIKDYLSHGNIDEIRDMLNQKPLSSSVDQDQDQDYICFINKRLCMNYFNVKDHLSTFMTFEVLSSLRDTNKDVYENLGKCIDVLLIGLLIYEFEINSAVDYTTSKSLDDGKSKLKTFYPDFFRGKSRIYSDAIFYFKSTIV